ncbi:MAG: phosphatase domain-containing protein [Bdellovibrionota bacterium]
MALSSKIFSCLLVMGFTSHSAGAASSPRFVVSDYDDTLKISNSQNKAAVAWNAFFQQHLYAGMAELMQAWNKGESSPKIAVVSNSPRAIAFEVRNNLSQKHVPFDTLLLRSGSTSGFNHKLQAIAATLPQGANGVLLIGDDTEEDPEIYAEAIKRFVLPSNTTIYIHSVRGRHDLPRGQVPYVTAFDIAQREFVAGRLSAEATLTIGEAILDADDKYVVPNFAFCPEGKRTECETHDAAVNRSCQRIAAHVQDICSRRTRR